MAALAFVTSLTHTHANTGHCRYNTLVCPEEDAFPIRTSRKGPVEAEVVHQRG